MRGRSVPLLVLDLDGTVRQGKDDALGRFVNGPEDVFVFPEAIKMMRAWKNADGRILGVSNQGGIALGHTTDDLVFAAMEETQHQTGDLFDKIVYCSHHPEASEPEKARCWCRKPSPGMIILGAESLSARYIERYPLHRALMVGDRDEDEQCAKLAGIDFEWATEWRAWARLGKEK